MLLTRAITAIVMIVALGGVLFLATQVIWILFCALFAAAAAHEWGRLIGLSRNRGAAFTVVIALFVAVWPTLSLPEICSQTLFAIAAGFWMFLVPYWLWKLSIRLSHGLGVAVGTLVIAAAAIALIALRDGGAWFVLCILGVIWVSDTAAYFVGWLLGRHKMAPRISPGKTWEGAFGAMAFVALYAIAWLYFSDGVLPSGFTDSPTGYLMLMATMLLLAILGIYGDLFESYLKRAAGVKDSGSVLPGHGGVLDRIDALLPVLPVAALLFAQQSFGG